MRLTRRLTANVLQLPEGANELKNALGCWSPTREIQTPATLAHFTTQLEAAKGKWNKAAETIWGIAKESGAMTLK
jgi:hypothetical protein